MTTLVIVHEGDDVGHGRTSARRREYVGPLGIIECPSLVEA
jgi:hypothetical protein